MRAASEPSVFAASIEPASSGAAAEQKRVGAVEGLIQAF